LSFAHRLARHANALVSLDDGISCGDVAKVLLLDDDTVRTWYRLYEDEGIEGPGEFWFPPPGASGVLASSQTTIAPVRVFRRHGKLVSPTAVAASSSWFSKKWFSHGRADNRQTGEH
jgi:hypothetical protein